MTRSEMNVRLSAVLESLLEADGYPVGESILAMPFSFGDWQDLREVLLRGGLVKIGEDHGVVLTPKGVQAAEASKAFYAKARV